MEIIKHLVHYYSEKVKFSFQLLIFINISFIVICVYLSITYFMSSQNKFNFNLLVTYFPNWFPNFYFHSYKLTSFVFLCFV